MVEQLREKDIVLSRKEAAAYLGVCNNTLTKMGIPCAKTGRRILYRQSALLNWLAKKEQQA
ncbi:MAG: helix-turn-helix domain-containing protein [Spirochaetales bacterium]|jgi:excisionase family DNA binding protein|nr:helix-turn-helix domain-containing protein [Spirochaetales bacterium]